MAVGLTLPRPGDVIAGKYRIDHSLGTGGMGAVFQATHRVTGKRFALKWLLPEVSNQGDAAQRFIREAQVAGRIEHPHIVEVYDVGQDGTSFYMVMELLEGESLADRVQRDGPLSVADACRLLIPCMHGVSEAHAVGIIHRDLKPANLYICRATKQQAEHAKVLDFGISKIAGQPESGELSSMTKSGTLIGTPHYMPLEQMRGRAVDHRADIYAFGVVLYQVLSARLPFAAQSFSDLVLALAHETPMSLDDLVDRLPRGLAAVVAKAMAREPADRFQSLHELILALEPYAGPAGHAAAGSRTSGWPNPSLSLPTPLSTESHSGERAPQPPSVALRYVLMAAVLLMLGAAVALWTQRDRLVELASPPRDTGPQPSAAGGKSTTAAPDPSAVQVETTKPPTEAQRTPDQPDKPNGEVHAPEQVELPDDILKPIIPGRPEEDQPPPITAPPPLQKPMTPIRPDKKRPPMTPADPGPPPEPDDVVAPVKIKPLKSPTGRVPAITEDDF